MQKKHGDSKETHFKVTKKHPFSSKQNKPHKDLCHLKQLVNAPPFSPPTEKQATPPMGAKTWRKNPPPNQATGQPGPPDLKVPTWRLRTTLAPPPLVGFFVDGMFRMDVVLKDEHLGGGFSSEKHMLQYENLTLINNPGDSKWPFYPLVGGHLTFEFGSLNHPQKGHNELPHPCTFVRVFWSNVLSEGSRSWDTSYPMDSKKPSHLLQGMNKNRIFQHKWDPCVAWVGIWNPNKNQSLPFKIYAGGCFNPSEENMQPSNWIPFPPIGEVKIKESLKPPHRWWINAEVCLVLLLHG